MLPNLHFIKGLDPVADAFAGTVTSDVVKATAEGVLFLISKGVGATGTSTVTVEACDDTTPTTAAAVAFMYRSCVTADTWSAWARATTSGFVTTAGSSQRYQVYAEASELASEGSSGYAYARLKAVEVVDSPVLGGIEIALINPRFVEVPATMI
jgi:hypothetical protein